ncbi:MAG TPA: hypothetical protein VH415_17135 [Nitrososphaeraceae archaeon]|jgi:hypothetical protein
MIFENMRSIHSALVDMSGVIPPAYFVTFRDRNKIVPLIALTCRQLQFIKKSPGSGKNVTNYELQFF